MFSFRSDPTPRPSTAHAIACCLVAALAACSRAAAPVERAPEPARLEPPAAPGAPEETRAVAPAAAVVPLPPLSAPALVPGSTAASPVQATEAETRQIAEDLYRGMDPTLPEKDRREAARTMAQDLQQIGRDAKADDAQNGAERARREHQGDIERAISVQQQCADLRLSLSVLQGLVRNGPRERMSAADLATIPGQIAAIEQRLRQLCA